MIIVHKIVPILLVITYSIILVSPLSQAKTYLKPTLVPDTMPNAIRVRLDNLGLCNERNDRRNQLGLSALPCNASDPQIDPETYTMNEYALGVLKAEVGGASANVDWWHTEAVKAVAVAARNYIWTHGVEQTDGSLIIGSTTAVQGFYPEKNIGGQAEEERYQLIINF